MDSKRKPWHQLPMNFRGRKSVQAKRVRIKPYGLTYLMNLERRVEKLA